MPGRTGAIRAGRAQVELYADDSQLARGLNRAGIRLKAFGAAVQAAGIKMLGVGGAIVAPMLGASKVFADVGSQVLDMSKRTGLSTEALSVLGYAADQTGASMESLEGSIRRMQRAIGEAVAGQKAYQDAFAVLGLNAAKLAALSPEEQFKAIGGAIGAIQNPALRTAAAMQMFGRAGTGILPMLEGGAAGMKAFEQQAKKLQQVISGPEAQAADRLGDAYQDIKKAVTALARGIGSALAPLLTEVGKKVALNIALAAKWVKEHRGMIVSVLKLGVGLMAAGAALIAFGIALRGVGSVLHVAAVVVGALVTVAGFLVTPIGAATAAIAGFSTAVLWASGAGGKAIQWLGSRFAALAESAKTTFKGIADAMAANNIPLAGKILWAGLKAEWARGVMYLDNLWIAFRNGFADTMRSLGPIVMEIGRRIVTTLGRAALEAVMGIGRAFANAWKITQVNKVATEQVKQAKEMFDLRTRLIKEREAAGGITPVQSVEKVAAAYQMLLDTLGRIDQERQKAIDALMDPGKAQSFWAELQEIWSKPLPPLDTRRFQESLEGLGLSPEQKAEQEKLHREWQVAMNQQNKALRAANTARIISEYKLPERPGTAKPGTAKKVAQLAEAAQEKAISVVGTFSAEATWGLGTGAAFASRTARATETLVEIQKRMLREMQDDQQEFA